VQVACWSSDGDTCRSCMDYDLIFFTGKFVGSKDAPSTTLAINGTAPVFCFDCISVIGWWHCYSQGLDISKVIIL
jgi:hypothetical protein